MSMDTPELQAAAKEANETVSAWFTKLAEHLGPNHRVAVLEYARLIDTDFQMRKMARVISELTAVDMEKLDKQVKKTGLMKTLEYYLDHKFPKLQNVPLSAAQSSGRATGQSGAQNRTTMPLSPWNEFTLAACDAQGPPRNDRH
jgi:hypothetical protein